MAPTVQWQVPFFPGMGRAQDLIRRMLAKDPLQRITIPQVRAHPFFREQLPPYLALPPERTVVEGQGRVDEDVLYAVAERMDVPDGPDPSGAHCIRGFLPG